MKNSNHTEEQIIGVLKQVEAGQTVKDLARELGVSEATIYTWKSQFVRMEVSEARRLKELEDENRRLGGPFYKFLWLLIDRKYTRVQTNYATNAPLPLVEGGDPREYSYPQDGDAEN